MDINFIHRIFLKCNSVSIDSRNNKKNSLFIAIKGDRFNANVFVKKALENGASYAIIDDENYFIDHRTILVKNALITLQKLAKFHREHLKIPIIALTGSNGKTTTKELIQVVLSKKYNTKSTLGNLNNHIGVPLTLLSFTSETEIGIIEMGANHKKEIEFLCDIANPDYGYITNFGKAHLEGFGGIEGVIIGKSEMYDYLHKNNKIAFINLKDAIQNEKSKLLKSYTFGINTPNANINIKEVQMNPFVRVTYCDENIQSHLIGKYNANNINAALTIGVYFEVSNEKIKEALEGYIPENNRSQLIIRGNNQIILDAYNANPSSMIAAIENFLELENLNKVLILGDMFELGRESKKEHKAIITLLSNYKNIKCYFIGVAFYANKIVRNDFYFFESFDDFSQSFIKNEFENYSFLIKGSRAMALERTLNCIQSH